MPIWWKTKDRAGALRPGAAILLSLALGGCLAPKDGIGVTRGDFPFSKEPVAPIETEMAQASEKAAVRSPLIDGLLTRQSVLPADGPYAAVARSVLEASKGAAVAELRVARLKAEAKAKNWLPSIGPSVSLTSLGAVATGLLLEQALFDNGQRKAERAFAAADVEVAAVTLSADVNDRLYKGLSNYVQGQRSKDLSRLAEGAVARMTDYDRIMQARVRGGISDRSEQTVIAQKLAEMQSILADDRNSAALAAADLAAMSATSLDGVTGLQTLPDDPGGPEALSVLLARAQGQQLIAQAKVERANSRPGVRATSSLVNGDLLGGIKLGTGELLGFGTKANRMSLEATDEVAARRVDQAEEEANRQIVSLTQRILVMKSRESEIANVLAQTAQSLGLFERQYKVGRRPLLELVGMFETYSKLERDHAALKYDIALLRLEIARQRGVLVDGAAL